MEMLVGLLPLVLLCVLAYFGFRRIFKKPGRAQSLSTPTPIGNSARHWAGGVEVDVVGEASYTANIARVAGNLKGQHADRKCVAHLVPEKGNKYDKNAVKVVIDGLLVGYLSRDDAEDFRTSLEEAGLGTSTTTCNAHILWGGIGREGKKINYSIKLDVDWFEAEEH